jgi:hypothetical protein
MYCICYVICNTISLGEKITGYKMCTLFLYTTLFETFLWKINTEKHVGLHVIYVILSDFIRQWTVLTYFNKTVQYKIL